MCVCAYMCVCVMCVCARACFCVRVTCVRLCACVHACVRALLRACVRSCVCAWMRVCMRLRGRCASVRVARGAVQVPSANLTMAGPLISWLCVHVAVHVCAHTCMEVRNLQHGMELTARNGTYSTESAVLCWVGGDWMPNGCL